MFTTGDLGDLPATDLDLLSAFSQTNYTEVGIDDGVYKATDGTNEYTVILFKNTITPGLAFTITWNGKTTLAPTISTVFLQILNRTTNLWETVASNASALAAAEFTLTAVKSTNLSNYIDANNQISCRVYQELIYD